MSEILAVGTSVQFIHNQPAGLSPEILKGVIVDVSVSARHGIEYRIAPEAANKMTRWRKPVQIVGIYGKGWGATKKH